MTKIENHDEFTEVINVFANKYPRRRIEHVYDVDRWMVRIDGKDKFCTSGYNLLYNLKRLCDALKDELL